MAGICCSLPPQRQLQRQAQMHFPRQMHFRQQIYFPRQLCFPSFPGVLRARWEAGVGTPKPGTWRDAWLTGKAS